MLIQNLNHLKNYETVLNKIPEFATNMGDFVKVQFDSKVYYLFGRASKKKGMF